MGTTCVPTFGAAPNGVTVDKGMHNTTDPLDRRLMVGDFADRTAPLYDDIGVGYAHVRRAEPRLAARIEDGLGDACSILDVGAGSGSYEPTGRAVIAVEPSPAMVEQRPTGAATVVRAVAESLPFPDRSFDATMAILTVHHWPDPVAGLREIQRVTSGPIVVFTFDIEVHDRQWLVTDYLPEMTTLDRDHLSSTQIADVLDNATIEVFHVPKDCVDGFCHAWWQRPAAYLDPAVRAGISGIARLPVTVVDRAMHRLGRDLADGTWEHRHSPLLALDEIDAGYRLVVSPGHNWEACE